MGRHSGPPARFVLREAVRLDAGEWLLVVVGLVLLAGGGLLLRSEFRGEERALAGTCVAAEVGETGAWHGRGLGGTAEIVYTLGGVRHAGTLHVDRRDAVTAGATVPICVSAEDTAVWVARVEGWNGVSATLWWWGDGGVVGLVLGAVALGNFFARHPWRTPVE
ncbi:hypothetical protein [Actinoplanes sp. NPDC051851]|uniref:hypothetical protein n=1 Tax=Actinoplanes sp. NPDC051851 TaxID=3154753 RepID=UPI003417C1A6